MKSLKLVTGCLAAALLTGPTSQAMAQQVNYTFTGVFSSAAMPFYTFTDWRNADGQIPFSLTVLIDTAAMPIIINDNTITQNYRYNDAVLGFSLTIGGDEFHNRRPIYPGNDLPLGNAAREALFSVDNFVPASFTDKVQLAVNDRSIPNGFPGFPQALGPLSTGRSYGINQIVNSVRYDSMQVAVASIDVVLTGLGMLSDAGIPDNADFASRALLGSVRVDFDVRFTASQPVQPANNAWFAGGDFQFAVSPVPDAPTWALTLAGLSLLGFKLRRRQLRQP